MIELVTRTRTAEVEAEEGMSLLDLAVKHKADWLFSCTRGTCARCRCLVEEGGEFLEEVTDAEWDRMEPEEFDQGYRLACQAIVKPAAGRIRAVNKPYF
ncbi:2Fe-2S iron-sulfur cluster-binding protein [Paenibacillus methanolicus]|uniref:2Fe-2S ferredoxin n=1 Tax=Paenibacillus methanolicus TaxID=582686 RepID=A0A5S5CEG5_9BACL|nr:2Fe-2S iron-sulfur cluster-binding protein [Paenibacillus methanolicus]TYP77775.1 2Fe-2S ferredoxin [Paenibacillus methanolicus]